MSSRFPIHRNSHPFLLIMCIDAPESTTTALSSGLRVGGAGRHQFSEGEKNVVLCFSLISRYFWPASTLLHGHVALAFLSILETDPQILEHWGCADEDHLGKSVRAKVFGLECWLTQHGFGELNPSGWLQSAAPYHEIRNPIVVYSSTKPLHFCHHSFQTSC